MKLKPKEEWTTAHDLDSLGEKMKAAIETEVPATFVSISQPIEDRTNEMISGSRADVAIQLFGTDLHQLTELGRRIERILRSTPGAGDVRVERALGLPMLQIRADRGRLSRLGIPADQVLSAVQATRQGCKVGYVFEQQRRYELRVLLPPINHLHLRGQRGAAPAGDRGDRGHGVEHPARARAASGVAQVFLGRAEAGHARECDLAHLSVGANRGAPWT